MKMCKPKISVEDIILQNDRRGISSLKPYLPSDYCYKAALSILDSAGTVFIVTGFYIVNKNCPETDGPPGAIAIARALKMLGYKVYFVTDQFSFLLMQNLSDDEDLVIKFPLTGKAESQQFALGLIDEYKPSTIISIERCGLTEEGTYLNRNGTDISNFNAKIDYLFQNSVNTIGIGDGGNEIGMGNYTGIISRTDRLPNKPCVTKTTHTIIASVSNWGGYGLVVALSELVKRNLLLSSDEEAELIKQAVLYGAVDGITQKPEPRVDGFDILENSKMISKLHDYLISEIV
jgi:hypothetical protein